MITFASFFNTIQGEGKSTGRNVSFVRMWTRNCFPNGGRCSFCDTVGQPYWQQKYSLKALDRFLRNEARSHIVLTGGEPFINLDDLQIIINKFIEHNKTFEIESNGSWFSDIPPYTFETILETKNLEHVTVSPKLRNSGVRYKYDLNSINYSHKKLMYKFVINPEQIEDNMNEVLQWFSTLEIPSENVWLMSETPCKIEDKKKIFNLAVERRFNYSPRLHIDLFGNIEEEI